MAQNTIPRRNCCSISTPPNVFSDSKYAEVEATRCKINEHLDKEKMNQQKNIIIAACGLT